MSTIAMRRELPHKIMENVWMWSSFSEEKDLFFNGYAYRTPDAFVLIDPPAATEEIDQFLDAIARPTHIIITNSDHGREAEQFRTYYQIPIFCHQLDAALLGFKADHTFTHGDIIANELEVIHLPHQKTPGESALYNASQQLLFIGDALIGKPAGMISMLPAEKYADPALAKQHLQALLDPRLEVNTLLLADGEPVFHAGKQVMESFLAGAS